MIDQFILLVVGLLGLWFGADLAIRGARNIAAHFKLTETFVGLTLLSIGTSLPEIAVSVAGGLDRLAGLETSGIVVGNKLGSAANQLTLILGLVGLMGVLYVKRRIYLREGGMLLGSILLLGIMGLDGQLTKFEGAIMLVIYFLYLFDLMRQERKQEEVRRPKLHPWMDSSLLIGGLLLVVFASDTVVRSGVELAAMWGVTQAFIGIFIVGLGTGLPELAVSFMALKKKEMEMSVANLIGSNICDLLFSLGAGTVISGFLFPINILMFDLPALFIISAIVIYLFSTGHRLARREAVMLLLMYVVYLSTRLALFG